MVKGLIKRAGVLVLVASLAISQVACSALDRLNDILPYASPMTNSLVTAGFIKPELGEKLKNDFDSGKTAKDNAEEKLSQIADNDPQKKFKEYVIYAALANEWRVIISRNHFAEANNTKVNAVVGLITDVLNILVERSRRKAGVLGGPAAASDVSDKTLDNKIDELEKLLKGK